MSTIYINTPFAKPEHDRIAALARSEGRSKGQQLRALALEALAKRACDQKPKDHSMCVKP